MSNTVYYIRYRLVLSAIPKKFVYFRKIYA